MNVSLLHQGDLYVSKHQVLERGICGVCNWCRAVKGEINAQIGKPCKRMSLHHEVYDKTCLLDYSLELCNRCHGTQRQVHKRRLYKIVQNSKSPQLLAKYQWGIGTHTFQVLGLDVK